MDYYRFNNRYSNYSSKPYMAKNMLIKIAETPPVDEDHFREETAAETGYLAVRVFTALGALPVENASVTVYHILENGEVDTHAQLITDASGIVPDIELPVLHDPSLTSRYYFTNYNLRVIAENYYTVNVLNIRIFPGITTTYRIDMIPVIAGETGTVPEQTFIIPPSPLDLPIE